MDSPKCLQCVDFASEFPFAQTYKVAGKPLFKCSRCKKVQARDAFDPVEFKWKEDRGAWDKFISDFAQDKVVRENLDISLKDKALKIESDRLDKILEAVKKDTASVKVSEEVKEQEPLDDNLSEEDPINPEDVKDV